MTLPTVMLAAPNTVFQVPSNGLVFGTGQSYVGQFRFLKDHWNNGDYIYAGEIRNMNAPWVPTLDVEPLDNTAVDSVYDVGPGLGGVIRTHFTGVNIYAPVLYWRNTPPFGWRLTAHDIPNIESYPPVVQHAYNKPSIPANPVRINDKEF